MGGKERVGWVERKRVGWVVATGREIPEFRVVMTPTGTVAI